MLPSGAASPLAMRRGWLGSQVARWAELNRAYPTPRCDHSPAPERGCGAPRGFPGCLGGLFGPVIAAQLPMVLRSPSPSLGRPWPMVWRLSVAGYETSSGVRRLCQPQTSPRQPLRRTGSGVRQMSSTVSSAPTPRLRSQSYQVRHRWRIVMISAQRPSARASL